MSRHRTDRRATSRGRRRRIVALTAVAMTVAGGCGVRPDAAPRDLPEDERNVALVVSSGGSDAGGANRIYLVAPGEERLLRAVPRDAATRTELIEVLLAGPNDVELAAQWSSVIPAETELISDVRTQGQVLTVDLTDAITELSGQNLALAVAQIVYTAAELEGVEAVQLRVEHEELGWPKANGEITTDPLRVYDYPNAIVTAQPDFPALPVTPAPSG